MEERKKSASSLDCTDSKFFFKETFDYTFCTLISMNRGSWFFFRVIIAVVCIVSSFFYVHIYIYIYKILND